MGAAAKLTTEQLLEKLDAEAAESHSTSTNERLKSKSLSLADQAKDMGRVDSLRHTILSLVVVASYERAATELETYIDMKKEYPHFRPRTTRHVRHCLDLINAIKAKKSLPGLNMLSMSKQKEMHEVAVKHFDELRETLKVIEHIERELRLDDVRSTVWVIKTAVVGAAIVGAVAFVKEFYTDIIFSGNVVLDKSTTDAVDRLFDRLGL